MSKQEAERLADALGAPVHTNTWARIESAHLTALQQLLRQWPDEEPCAWVNGDELSNMMDDRPTMIVGKPDGWRRTPIYTAPQDQSARIAELERAIDDALVSAHIGTLESFPNPRAAIHALEAWNATVAIDHAVSEEAAKLHERIAELESALRFYASGDHFNYSDDAWDTVSGEPQNFWCDEAGTATVEDGTVAREALVGVPLEDERIAEMRLDLDALRTENATLRATLKQARETLSAIVDFVDGPAEGKRSDVFFLRIGKARIAIQAIGKVQP